MALCGSRCLPSLQCPPCAPTGSRSVPPTPACCSLALRARAGAEHRCLGGERRGPHRPRSLGEAVLCAWNGAWAVAGLRWQGHSVPACVPSVWWGLSGQVPACRGQREGSSLSTEGSSRGSLCSTPVPRPLLLTLRKARRARCCCPVWAPTAPSLLGPARTWAWAPRCLQPAAGRKSSSSMERN